MIYSQRQSRAKGFYSNRKRRHKKFQWRSMTYEWSVARCQRHKRKRTGKVGVCNKRHYWDMSPVRRSRWHQYPISYKSWARLCLSSILDPWLRSSPLYLSMNSLNLIYSDLTRRIDRYTQTKYYDHRAHISLDTQDMRSESTHPDTLRWRNILSHTIYRNHVQITPSRLLIHDD